MKCPNCDRHGEQVWLDTEEEPNDVVLRWDKV